MKSKVDEQTERLLLALKFDVKNLFSRIKDRRDEYIAIFAIKRQRDHFGEVFFSRYNQVTINELLSCNTDILTALDRFYLEVENIKWYLDHTQDMPNMVEDKLARAITALEDHYNILHLYLDAELGISELDDSVSLTADDSETESGANIFGIE